MTTPNLTTIQQSLQQAVVGINALVQAIKAVFPQGTAITSTATGGAATLPANPQAFMTVTGQDGNTYKVPLYNP